MKSARHAERYTADYGNLFLEVFIHAKDGESVYEYTVTDKGDGFICWTGRAPNLAIAQSDAMQEAQLFLNPYVARPPAPEWALVNSAIRI